MLTETELSSMRSVAAQALPGTAVIQAQTFVSDGGGGGSTTWAPSGTVDCRVVPVALGAGANEGLTGGRITPDSTYVITLPAETSVTTNSRIISAGGTFNVEAIRERSWNVTTRVEARKAA